MLLTNLLQYFSAIKQYTTFPQHFLFIFIVWQHLKEKYSWYFTMKIQTLPLSFKESYPWYSHNLALEWAMKKYLNQFLKMRIFQNSMILNITLIAFIKQRFLSKLLYWVKRWNSWLNWLYFEKEVQKQNRAQVSFHIMEKVFEYYRQYFPSIQIISLRIKLLVSSS